MAPLEPAALAAVEAAFEATRDAETRLRYQMVLLAGEGRTASQVARVVRRSHDTVLRVLRRYRAQGPAGVPRRRPPGRRPRRPAAWDAELLRVVELDPHALGVRSAVWTTGLLAAYLLRATGHRAGMETVRQRLHWAGYVCKRPTWSLKRKAEEDPAWAKNGYGWRRS